MQIHWGRATAQAVAVPVALVVLTACGAVTGSGTVELQGTAGPAAATTTAPPASPSADADPAASASPGTGSGAGCPAGGAPVPEGAGEAATQDLDGDRQEDTLWLAKQGDKRLLGVTTASGARFSISFSAGPVPPANAVAGRLGDGSAVILLDLAEEARLFAVSGCKIVQTMNSQGSQYAFDKAGKYGTGVGCPALGAEQKRQLVGYLTKPAGYGAGYVVTQTTIRLSKDGTQARNGATETIGDGLPGGAQKVVRGEQINCAQGDRAFEPVD